MTRLSYPLDEAAEQLGVSEPTVRREIQAGRLKARRIRRRTVVLHAELERYLAARAPVLSGSESERAAQQPKSRGRVTRLFDITSRNEGVS